jgi:hypothetical protein
MKTWFGVRLQVAAGLLSLANLSLIWWFRFLPLYDYPIWLYEVRIIRGLAEPMFHEAYELVKAPVPNLGFVAPVWVLSSVLPLEMCGKLLLSVCVVGFPWAVWYCVNKISGNVGRSVAYIGFPFAFNIYFYGGNAFLLGFIVTLLTLGYFIPRLERMSSGQWTALGVVLLITYFAHLLAFVLLLLALGGAILSRQNVGTNIRSLLLALLPSLVSFGWYTLSALPPGDTAAEWSVWSLAQNVLKPVFLFVKSYGIPNALPLTALNLLWLGVLTSFVCVLAKSAHTAGILDRRFVLPAIVSIIGVLALPKSLMGVYEPGVRFGLPAVLFLVLLFSRAGIPAYWRVVFLIVAACVTFCNIFYFKNVDEQMSELYTDITTNVQLRDMSFRSMRFDYPPPRHVWDIGAASIDPLFGAVYYAALPTGGGEAWIFGTALLRAKGKCSSSTFTEESKEELAKTLLADGRSLPCDVVVLVGNDPAVDEQLTHYRGHYWRGRYWTILTMH